MTGDRNDEIIRHFDVVAEGLRSEIRSVAEGHGILVDGQKFLAERVKGLDSGLQNLAVGLTGLGDELRAFRAEVSVEFSELRSMVKFSYAELDRRIRTLEGAIVSLTDRMDRLEATRS